MTDVLTFSQLLTGIGIFAGMALLYPLIKLSALRLMRENSSALDEMVERLSKELVEFRRFREEDLAKIKMLTETEARIEERVIRQGAVLYSQEVYIRRLERLCLEAGKKLPSRSRMSEELEG